ncbi:uncharacterized protein PAC_02444 [Phialocephala subalpina]|uniref:2EXR domain-containing protein n=1 Tax=Phialocephala subalpina TaxID=576137 RepID=A0A1L7WII2_9HELO|nr:uncharacterized protein PAC_02444 [Phialocephala subalpina]
MEVQITTRIADSTAIHALDPKASEAGGIQEISNSSTGTLKDLVNTPPGGQDPDRILLGREFYVASFTDTLKDPAIASSTAFHTSLDRFKDLPGEVANKIWKYALPGPRTIAVTTKSISKYPKSTENYGGRYYPLLKKDEGILIVKFGVHPVATALLHVCRRSRDIAQQKYTPCFRGTHRKPIYFCREEDTLYFPTSADLLYFSGQGDYGPYGSERKTFERRVECPTMEAVNHITNMPSLRTITVVRDGWFVERLLGLHPLSVSSLLANLEDDDEEYVLDHWVWKWTKPLNVKESTLIEHENGFRIPEVVFEKKGIMELKAHVAEMTKNEDYRWLDIAVIPTNGQ